jgi:hypothetical protein
MKVVRRSTLSKPADWAHRKMPNLYADYKEIPADEMGISFNKEKLLIRGIGNPENYSVLLKNDQDLELQLYPRNTTFLQIFPEKLVLSKKSKNENVCIYSEANCNAEIDLLHINHEKKEYVIKKIFFVRLRRDRITHSGL